MGNDLVGKYWNFVANSEGECTHDDKNNEKLLEARKKPQVIDIARNEKGHVLTCQELQNLISEKVGKDHEEKLSVSSDNAQYVLVAYAVPGNSATLREQVGSTLQTNFHLHWKKTKESTSRKRRLDNDTYSDHVVYSPPDVVTMKRTALENDSKFLVEISLS